MSQGFGAMEEFMKIDIQAILWGASDNIIYGPIFLLLIFFVCIRLYRIWRVRHILVSAPAAAPYLRNCSMAKMLIKALLLIIALIGLFIAFLNPMWNKKEESVEQEGRDLFIALDISRSMLAGDCVPDRLTCAKEKIKKLLKKLETERVGLILFSGSSVVQCPLTPDFGAFLMFLDSIDAETISSGTTALDSAIKTAMQAFIASGQRKNKLLVIFTDGEDFSSNLSSVKAEAVKMGLHIFTVGVGTVQGAPIPVYDMFGNPSGHQKDDKGNVVISHLNEGILQAVSRDSGSIYIHLSTDDSDIASLVNAVHGFEKEKFDSKNIAQYVHQYYYFVIIAFLCMILEWIL